MGRLRGCLWITAGLVIAVAAAVVAYITLTNAMVQSTKTESVIPKVGVVVTTRAISMRTLLTSADVELKQLPVDTVPEGSLRSVDEAIGRMTTVDFYAAEVLVVDRLVNPTSITGDGRTALLMTEEQVLIAFPAGDLMSQIGVLKPGDHVDLLVTFDFPVSEVGSVSPVSGGSSQSLNTRMTFVVLQNLTIAAIVGGQPPVVAQPSTGLLGAGSTTTSANTALTNKNPEALLLTVSPQDALVIKYLKDNGTTFDIALRAPGVEKAFTTVPVDVQWLIDRYSIPVPNSAQ